MPALLAGLCAAGGAVVVFEALAGSARSPLSLALLFGLLLIAFLLAGRRLQQDIEVLDRRAAERLHAEAADDALAAERPDGVREQALAAALAAAPGAAWGLAAASGTWLLVWTGYLAFANPLAAAALALSAALVAGWHHRQWRAPFRTTSAAPSAYRQLIGQRDAARLNAARAEELRLRFLAACAASSEPAHGCSAERLRGSLLTPALILLLIGGALFANRLPGVTAPGSGTAFSLLSVLLGAIPLLLLAEALSGAVAAARAVAAWQERRTPAAPAGPQEEAAPFRSIRLVGVVAAAPRLGPVDLEIAAGEFVVLGGETGPEATAVLRILAGLERPEEGRVELDGAALDAAGAGALRARTAALLPDSIPFERPLPARETHEAEIAALLVALGLPPERFLAGGRFRTEGASSGEAARLALAGAMLEGRPLLLIDHPVLDRDAAWRERLAADWAPRLTARGTTLVVASGDPMLAAAADRHLRLRGGTIIDATSGGRYGHERG